MQQSLRGQLSECEPALAHTNTARLLVTNSKQTPFISVLLLHGTVLHYIFSSLIISILPESYKCHTNAEHMTITSVWKWLPWFTLPTQNSCSQTDLAGFAQLGSIAQLHLETSKQAQKCVQWKWMPHCSHQASEWNFKIENKSEFWLLIKEV